MRSQSMSADSPKERSGSSDERAVQVVETTCSGLPSNERSCRGIHGHRHRLEEGGEFIGLHCPTISIIANGTAEAGKTPRIRAGSQRPDLTSFDGKNVDQTPSLRVLKLSPIPFFAS